MGQGPSDPFVLAPPPRPIVPVLGSQRTFPVRRVYCVGQNYAEHAREMGASGRQPPFFFAKPADAVTIGTELPFPAMTENLHHEVELVVALGGMGRDVSAVEAGALIYGYAVGVDLTRRDLQAAAKAEGRPWTTAKGFDRSAPVSAIRPAGRGDYPERAEITLSVNGQERQRGNTADMIWSVPEIIAELSRYFELAPGDLIFTGTPAGVGPLQPGDRVDCAVAGVGRLQFSIG